MLHLARCKLHLVQDSYHSFMDEEDGGVVEVEGGVAVSNSQEVDEVEEVTMGDDDEVRVEGDFEEERDSRARVENRIGRTVDR